VIQHVHEQDLEQLRTLLLKASCCQAVAYQKTVVVAAMKDRCEYGDVELVHLLMDQTIAHLESSSSSSPKHKDHLKYTNIKKTR
jgi:hypothetical protein